MGWTDDEKSPRFSRNEKNYWKQKSKMRKTIRMQNESNPIWKSLRKTKKKKDLNFIGPKIKDYQNKRDGRDPNAKEMKKDIIRYIKGNISSDSPSSSSSWVRSPFIKDGARTPSPLSDWTDEEDKVPKKIDTSGLLNLPNLEKKPQGNFSRLMRWDDKQRKNDKKKDLSHIPFATSVRVVQPDNIPKAKVLKMRTPLSKKKYRLPPLTPGEKSAMYRIPPLEVIKTFKKNKSLKSGLDPKSRSKLKEFYVADDEGQGLDSDSESEWSDVPNDRRGKSSSKTSKKKGKKKKKKKGGKKTRRKS